MPSYEKRAIKYEKQSTKWLTVPGAESCSISRQMDTRLFISLSPLACTHGQQLYSIRTLGWIVFDSKTLF